MNKLRRLRRLKVGRVDLVPKGANQFARIELFKRAAASLSAEDRKVREDRDEAAEVDSMGDKKTAEDFQAKVEEMEKLQAEVKKTKDELEKTREELAETPKAELDKAQEEVTKLKAELEKSKDADVQKQLDETTAEVVELRKEQREAKFAKAAKPLSTLGSVEEIAEMLADVDESASDKTSEFLNKLLKGIAKQAEESDLFKRLSTGGNDSPTTAEERVNEMARDRVAKGESETIEQAKVAVVEADPELAKELKESVRS